jgi:hypothetical protein
MKTIAWFRTIVGFLVAPVAPGVLADVLAAISAGPEAVSQHGLSGALSGALWIVGLSAALGYPVAIVLGVPLFVVFRWRRWNGLLVYVLTGAFLGLVVYSVYFAVVLLDDDTAYGLRNLAQKLSHTAPQLIPAGMISGAVAVVSFWLIARPDRT